MHDGMSSVISDDGAQGAVVRQRDQRQARDYRIQHTDYHGGCLRGRILSCVELFTYIWLTDWSSYAAIVSSPMSSPSIVLPCLVNRHCWRSWTIIPFFSPQVRCLLDVQQFPYDKLRSMNLVIITWLSINKIVLVQDETCIINHYDSSLTDNSSQLNSSLGYMIQATYNTLWNTMATR